MYGITHICLVSPLGFKDFPYFLVKFLLRDRYGLIYASEDCLDILFSEILIRASCSQVFQLCEVSVKVIFLYQPLPVNAEYSWYACSYANERLCPFRFLQHVFLSGIIRVRNDDEIIHILVNLTLPHAVLQLKQFIALASHIG